LFRWFKGKEVAFALGLNLSIARSGSVLNDIVSPLAAQYYGVRGTLALGVALCIFSFAANLASAILDRSEGAKARLPEATGEDDQVSARDILKLPRLYWLLAVYCLILYCAILPFNNIASAFFVETFYPHLPLAEAQQHAGQAMALLFMASAIGTPPFGALIDTVGMRSKFLFMSALLLTSSYSMIFAVKPMMSMFCLGMVYMVFAGALWPAFALTVPQKELGTAYGIAMALQNGGLAIMPLIVGYLQTMPAVGGHYTYVVRLFTFLGTVGIVVSALVIHENHFTRGLLDLPSGEAENCEKGNENKLLKRQAKTAEDAPDAVA